MPMVRGFLRIIKRRDRWGRPVDPDYGIDEGDLEEGGGEDGAEYPDQGLPGVVVLLVSGAVNVLVSPVVPVKGCLGRLVQLIPIGVLKKVVASGAVQVVPHVLRMYGRGLPVVGFRLIQAGVSVAGGRNGPVTVCQFSRLSPASLTTLCLRSRVKVRLRLIRLRARSGRRCLLVFQVVRQLLLWRFPASVIAMSSLKSNRRRQIKAPP